MLKPPAHKFDRYPYLKNSSAEPWPYPPEEQKLSFKEWWEMNEGKAAFRHISMREAELIWLAAQENV